MFVYKTDAQLEAMTAAERDTYAVEKRAHETALQKEAIKEATDLMAKNHKEESEAQKATITELKEDVRSLKEKGNSFTKDNVLAVSLKESKDEILNVAKGGNDEIVIKALSNRASVATNSHTEFIDGVGQLNAKQRSFYDICRKVPMGDGNNNGSKSYLDWDEATTVRAAAMVAEGAAFAESTAKFKMYSIPLRKIGDTLPVTEEFFEDEVMAAGELELFLETNVETVVDYQLINGDNTGENLKGLVSSSTAYTAVASGITDANIHDLCIKVKEDITKYGAKYKPDFVLMNIADINKMKLKKDTTNNYVFNFNDPRIDSLMIVEDNNVVANTMFVGDSRFAVIYEKGGVVLSKGLVGSQFTSDMLTLKARKRLLFLIRAADATGFRKVTSISAALVTLATP